MPLFKRKADNLIPPVVAPPSSLPSATSPRPYPNTYSITSASRDDTPYNPDRLPYSRNRGVGDVYSRGTAELDKDRDELFSGYNPAKSGSGRFFNGPNKGDLEAGEDEDEDVERIKQQTRFVKQESVNSTRNALRLAREAEETGRNTLGRLAEQSDKLNSTERYLDMANADSNRARDNAKTIKELNGSIFKPVIRFRKDRKPGVEVEDGPDQTSYGQRKNAGGDLLDGNFPDDNLLRDDLMGTERPSTQRERRKRYQFEESPSDDETEDRLEKDLDDILAVTGRLKILGNAMGKELDDQIKLIDNIGVKTGRLDDNLQDNTERLKRIK